MHKFVLRSACSIPADGDICVKQEPSELSFPPIKEELDEEAAREVDCSEQKPCDMAFPPIKEEVTHELPADGDVCVKQEPITEELNKLCSCTGLCQQVKEEITIEEHPAAPVFLYRSVPASEGGDNYRRAPRCPRYWPAILYTSSILQQLAVVYA
ncbi:uncharacterized protein LOC134536607 isoform X8 [Bacillus rossius redtenbacheri]|uniref:uncharacterized protein LOC134536607 isoform X8 n=1 Tax=Bacillus rossius redtenbacheri TaxID=93214 RepID=UPI002FDDED7A